MKKIFAVLFSVILIFSTFLASPSSASANLPVVPTDAKATITIEKSSGNAQLEGTLKADVAEINISVGQYAKHMGNINFYLEGENGNRSYLNYDNLVYQSTNANIFTVSDNYLHGISLGSANLVVTYNNQQVIVKVNVIEADVTLKFENIHNASYVNLYTLRSKGTNDYDKKIMEKGSQSEIYSADCF